MNQLEGQSLSIEESVALFGPRWLLQRVRSHLCTDTGWQFSERIDGWIALGNLWLELNA